MELLNVQSLADMLGLKPSYIRKMCHEGVLPYYKPFGKMLYFKKDEILSIITDKKNRIPSVAEIVNNY